jgi:hypothetical protein
LNGWKETNIRNIRNITLFCQQMHHLSKHKMLQFVFRHLYMAPTCFGLLGPSSGCIHWNLAKVTVSLKYQLKHIVKIAVCAVAMKVSVCSVCTGCCAACDTPHSTQYTHYSLERILPLHNNNFVGKIILYLSKCTVKQQLKF